MYVAGLIVMQKVDFSIIFDTRFLRRKVIALIATLGHARAKCWAFLPLSLFWYKNSCYHFQLHYGKGMFQEIGSGPLDTQILKCFCSKTSIHKASVSLWFNLKPDNTPNEFSAHRISYWPGTFKINECAVICELWNLGILSIWELNSQTNLFLAYYKG